MSSPLLRDAIDNALRKDASGKLLQQTTECCSQCSGNNPFSPCLYYGRADICADILDSQCNRVHPPSIYFCAQKVGQTEADRPRVGATTFRSGVCYTYKGQLYTIEQLRALGLTDTQINNASGDLLATPNLSCISPQCQLSADVCRCLCYAYTDTLPQGGNGCTPIPPLSVNPANTFCCFGKKDAEGIIHFDFNYTRTYEERWDFSQRRAFCPNDVRNDNFEVCCSQGASCVTNRYLQRSCGEVGCKQFCLAGCGQTTGCCEWRGLEESNPIQLQGYAGSGIPSCPTTPGVPYCFCNCPNNPRWEGWRRLAAGVEACIPVNIGTYTVVLDCPGFTDDIDGCKSSNQGTITTTIISTCSHVASYGKSEDWGPMVGECSCGTPNPIGSRGCCKCDIHHTVTDNHDWYYFPLGDTSLCGQCRAEIAAFGQPSGQIFDTPTGSINSVLFG